MKKLILTICLTLLSLAANAQFNSGNKLLEDMNGSSAHNRMYALGYVVGVVDSLNRFMFCVPSNSTAGQLHDMVRNYLTNVPADRHLPADVIVTKVLAASFPCPKGNV